MLNPIKSCLSEIKKQKSDLEKQENFLNLCEEHQLFTFKNGITVLTGKNVDSIIPLMPFVKENHQKYYLSVNQNDVNTTGHYFDIPKDNRRSNILTIGSVSLGFIGDSIDNDILKASGSIGLSYLFYPEHKLHYTELKSFAEALVKYQYESKCYFSKIKHFTDIEANRVTYMSMNMYGYYEIIIITQNYELLSYLASCKDNEMVTAIRVTEVDGEMQFTPFNNEAFKSIISTEGDLR